MDVDSSDDEMWQEVVGEANLPSVQCLFCPTVYNNAFDLFKHCSMAHNFNIHVVQREMNLDTFGYIKMINYIRNKRPTVERFMTELSRPAMWMDDQFMRPVISDDPLLMVDIDDIVDQAAETLCPRHAVERMKNETANVCPHGVANVTSASQSVDICRKEEIGNTPVSFGSSPRILKNDKDASCSHVKQQPQKHELLDPGKTSNVSVQLYNDLVNKYKQNEGKLSIIQEEMNRCLGDMSHMKMTYNRLLSVSVSQNDKASSNKVSGLSKEEDEGYFSSYAHFSIHHEMLKDKTRTEAYRDLMANNVAIVKDKTVLDVGCGTAILSMFAAQSGASHVTGIDQSDIIIHAIDIVNENQLNDTITLVKGRLEDTSLPREKYDVIISEWMGYFLLYESMLETVLYARDKYLQPTGMVYPDRCSISIAAVDDQVSRKSYLEFWDDVYGFKMTSLKKDVCREACVMVVSPEMLVTHACIVKNIDIMTCEISDLQFTTNFSLTVERNCSITGLVAYFDAFFERGLTAPIKLSTSPAGEVTHWKQTVFNLPSTREMNKGEIIAGTLTCRKLENDPRSLTIEIKIFDDIHTYVMP